MMLFLVLVHEHDSSENFEYNESRAKLVNDFMWFAFACSKARPSNLRKAFYRF